jgi:hypothetical protein
LNKNVRKKNTFFFCLIYEIVKLSFCVIYNVEMFDAFSQSNHIQIIKHFCAIEHLDLFFISLAGKELKTNLKSFSAKETTKYTPWVLLAAAPSQPARFPSPRKKKKSKKKIKKKSKSNNNNSTSNNTIHFSQCVDSKLI